MQRAAGSLLAFENVTFRQTLFLSKFYEAIEAIDGVAFANITEFRREGQDAGYVESSGKIELGALEIPKVPDDAAYAGSIRVRLEGVN